jgi:hypothetical protein
MLRLWQGNLAAAKEVVAAGTLTDAAATFGGVAHVTLVGRRTIGGGVTFL